MATFRCNLSLGICEINAGMRMRIVQDGCCEQSMFRSIVLNAGQLPLVVPERTA
ncbi:MAG TPA: hypothetical protein VFE42_12835 [Chloroflexota bacterium]|nr:hypothetical protein [Chloroflexota bacterium]